MKIYVGIDWSEDKHCVHAYRADGTLLLQLEIAATVAGYQALTRALQALNPQPADCLVAIETAHNPLVDYLHRGGYTLYVLAPTVVSSNRGRQGSSGAKDDDRDARLLADIVRTDRRQLLPWQPDGPLVRQMRLLLSSIDDLTKLIVGWRNRLRAHLLYAYPQALAAFGDVQTAFAQRFLAAFPDPAQLQTLSFEEFTAFCRQQRYYMRKRYPELWATLREPAPPVPAELSAVYSGEVAWRAPQLLDLYLRKQQLIAEVQALFQQHPDAFIFASLPGAGDLLAPKLLVMFGDHRARYPVREILPAIAGTAPVTVRSGKSSSVRFRFACNHSYRNTAQQFAISSTLQSAWAATYVHRARRRGLEKNEAYRCLANRWLQVIWALWQRREAYDAAYHLQRSAQGRRPQR